MWTDDLDVVETCNFYRSLLNFDSIDSIGAHTDTDSYVYVKTPSLMVNEHACELLWESAAPCMLSTRPQY